MKIEPVPNRAVTVPDGEDMGFRNVEGVGRVRPGVVKQLIRQELVSRGVVASRRERRRLERLAKAPAIPAPGGPIRPGPRLSDRETTDRMAAILLGEYDKHRTMFPASTLAQFLDARSAAEVEEAYRKGEPIDRATVREGIGKLWEHAQRQQKGAT